MSIKTQLRNSIATAFCLGVWFSAPLAAQDSPVDRLFAQLQQAAPEDVRAIEAQIYAQWGKSGSAAMDLLLRRGEEALAADAPEQAVEHFTAAVDHAPDFAEAYHGRATAYFQMGLFGPAMDDLRQTLILEPRHLGAMSGVAVILEQLDRPEDAVVALRQVQQLSPADPDVAAALERLDQALMGPTL